ncbi:MAG: PilZ domain-containing protein [Sandaracinaceae bacterium]
MTEDDGFRPRPPRATCRARVWCEDEDVTLYVRAMDVSEGGLCVRTARPFHEGQTVRVGISGSQGDAVAEARVAWSRPERSTPAMGLQLVRFERGAAVYEAIVSGALRRADRVSQPDPWDGSTPTRPMRIKRG